MSTDIRHPLVDCECEDHGTYWAQNGDAVPPCPVCVEIASLKSLVRELAGALSDLRDGCAQAYGTGRVYAEPYIRAGNVLAKFKEAGK
jgi:hypothetical protein